LTIAFRFITGIIFGVEFNPAPGVYVCLYLGIVELAYYDETKVDD